ncbi:DUF4760 domain-containing protein [Capnocytophaga leadbetteri]|uniref:DUF4760 domain-containing protein n=1 Tax=Capnocytophaga leadbetteri TaxID=327575 RepID=UPI0028E7E000|nr:DUF4760 domain-containing protein [Capnocytophaga leadbetteri]
MKVFSKMYSIRLIWILIILFILFSLIVFFVFTYLLNAQFNESLDYTTKIILSTLAFLTLLYHLHNLENQIITQKESNKQRLAKYTYDICSDYRKPFMTDINETTRKLLLKKEKWLNDTNKIEKFVEYLEEKPKKRKSLITTMNYFESIASMVITKDLNNEIVKSLFCKLFYRYYDRLKYYIEYRQRVDGSKSWGNFERIVKKWKEETNN